MPTCCWSAEPDWRRWLTDALTTIGASDRLRDMSAGIELRAASERDDREGVGCRPPLLAQRAERPIGLVENVRDALVAAVLAARGWLRGTSRRRYSVGLSDVDAEIRRLIEDIPADDRGIVTNHDALGYFIDEYGLRFVGFRVSEPGRLG